jgi:hypothetical protein
VWLLLDQVATRCLGLAVMWQTRHPSWPFAEGWLRKLSATRAVDRNAVVVGIAYIID